MSTSRIWINVTSSYLWHGPVVGIVRTETEVVKRLLVKYSSRVGLCIRDETGFTEISQSEYLFKNQLNNVSNNSKKSLYEGMSWFEKKRAQLTGDDAILHLTPKFLRPWVQKVSKYYSCKFVNSSHSPQKYQKVNPTPRKDLLKIFGRGDVFLTLGLDWDYDFSKDLFSLRKERGVAVVSFCYDIIPILYPQYCVGNVAKTFLEYIIQLAEGSDYIMCISKKTRADLKNTLENVGARIPKLAVVRLGSDGNSDLKNKNVVSSNVETILSERYILYVSTIERRKNHEVLYRAYHRLISEGKGEGLPKLVFVGMTGWGVQDLLNDICLDPLTKNHIIMLGRVNDRELELLYKNSEFTAFPSLYEGWGLGVAESLQHGKFVLASNAGSLPEVGGDLIWYEDPWNVFGWAQKIEELTNSKETLKTVTERVKNEYKPQTWDDTCIDISAVIDRIAKPS